MAGVALLAVALLAVALLATGMWFLIMHQVAFLRIDADGVLTVGSLAPWHVQTVHLPALQSVQARSGLPLGQGGGGIAQDTTALVLADGHGHTARINLWYWRGPAAARAAIRHHAATAGRHRGRAGGPPSHRPTGRTVHAVTGYARPTPDGPARQDQGPVIPSPNCKRRAKIQAVAVGQRPGAPSRPVPGRRGDSGGVGQLRRGSHTASAS